VLRDALEREPRSAAARHALGLLLARQRRLAEALVELETAARLAPERARYGYVHAVALHETGHAKPAVAALARVLERHPYDRDTLAALVGYTREQNDFRQALVYARRLVEIEPANAEVHALVQRLEIETRR
jgi:Flp pilus assembly protein TadD